MITVEIQKQTKFVTNSKGRPVEAILPINIYNELIELQNSIEIFQQEDTQAGIQRAKNDIDKGDTISFRSMNEAFEWLDK